jgi:hypothetical protein
MSVHYWYVFTLFTHTSTWPRCFTTILLWLYDDRQFHRGDLIFIIIALGEVILLLYLNISLHLNIINCFVKNLYNFCHNKHLDKTSALDQPCYQWCKLLPTVRLNLITKPHTSYTEPLRFNNITTLDDNGVYSGNTQRKSQHWITA